MAKFSTTNLHGMTIRESATDGSDFTNPDADYRRLFLGEDGQLHVKDTAGAVTDIGSGAVATDAIWDAKGDLAGGTGANTAARLAVAANGSSLRAASGAATGLEWQLNSLANAVAPAVTDDSGDGYSVGSRWIDTTADKEYVCLDATVGAAVWTETTGGGGSVATDAIWDAAGDLVQGTGANTAARLAVGAVGTVVRSTGSTNAYAYPAAGRVRFVYPEGYSPASTVPSGINLGINGGTIACPVIVPATMYLEGLNYRNNNTATARSMEWGLYRDDGTSTPPRVAYGTASFTPTVAANRTSTATGAPVTVPMGAYWILMRNTGGATDFQTVCQLVGAGHLLTTALHQTITLASALADPEELVTGWTRTGAQAMEWALMGRVFGESSVF